MRQFTILKTCLNIFTAKKQAEDVFDAFFDFYSRYIRESSHHILRERFAAEGHVGYLIRVESEAPEKILDEMERRLDTMDKWEYDFQRTYRSNLVPFLAEGQH